MQDKEKKLAHNTIIFIIGSLGSKFIQFFLVPFYTWSMSTAEFGSGDIVLTMSEILVPVFSLSISDGLLRFGLDKTLRQENVLKCCLCIDCIGAIISIFCIPIFELYHGLSQWLALFLTIMILRIYRDYFSIYLKINDKNRMYAIDGILYTFTLCIFGILLLSIFKLGVKGYLLSYVIANLVSIIFLLIVGKPIKKIKSGHLDKKLFKDIVRYSIPMVANAMAWWIITASDRLVIQYFMSNDAVGLYSVSSKIPTIISTFSGVFLQAWAISCITEYDSDRDKIFYQKIFDQYYSVMIFVATILIAIIRPFMHVYVSPSFECAWEYTPVLISAAVYSGIFGYFGVIYAAAKNSINVTITTCLGAACNMLLNILLIPCIGIQGAAIATYISWLITSIVRIIDTRKFIAFKINYAKCFFMMTMNIIQCVCVVKLPLKYSIMISAACILTLYYINKNIINGFIIATLNRIKAILGVR